MNILKKYVALAAAAGILVSCSDDDDPEIPLQQEVITGVELHFTNESDESTFEVHYDGDVVEHDDDHDHEEEEHDHDEEEHGDHEIVLAPNTSYEVELLVFGEAGEHDHDHDHGSERTVSSDDDHDHEEGTINEVIESTADGHQVFYIFEDAALATYEYLDFDENNNPLGLRVRITTGDAGTGTMQLILKHGPEKPNNGTPEEAGGDDDINITFDLEVE